MHVLYWERYLLSDHGTPTKTPDDAMALSYSVACWRTTARARWQTVLPSSSHFSQTYDIHLRYANLAVYLKYIQSEYLVDILPNVSSNKKTVVLTQITGDWRGVLKCTQCLQVCRPSSVLRLPRTKNVRGVQFSNVLILVGDSGRIQPQLLTCA